MVVISLCEGVLIFSLLNFVNAQDTCRNGARIIGSDNRIQYEADNRLGGRLYLNTDNPAQCNGTITRWEYCYYPPIDHGIYHVLFAIYRQGNFGNLQLYQRQSPILNLSVSVDNELNEGFLCSSFIPAEQISVQQGDIIGICLPRTNSLDIVSDTSGGNLSDDRLLCREDDCSNIPGIVINLPPLTVLVFQENRIAHFYAQITTNTGDRIPITNSESEPPTPPPVSDQPPMCTTTMLIPSRQLSITPTVTVIASEGQLPTSPTSMAFPLMSTTTEAVSDRPETDPTTVHNIMLTSSRQLSIAPSVTISGGQVPTSTALPVVLTSTETGQIIILANLGIIEGSAIGAAALVMIALLLIILSIAICAARWRSKRSSLNRSNISVSEVGSRNEQLLTSTEVSYDYVRGSPFFQDTDGLITKKNSAYESTRIEMSPNIAYRNKKAVHYHHPLTESLLHNNEYAYISQPA